MRNLTYILLSFLLFSCSEKEYEKADVMEIKNIGYLSTTEFTIGKIVKLDDSQYTWDKWGERKILISTKAVVKAGVDLSKIKEEDIKVNEDEVTIVLPAAELTSFNMDPRLTHTELESISGFRDGFTHEEKNVFLKQGEAAIRKELPKTGIFKDAQNNAEDFIIEFYKNLGFKKVTVIQEKTDNA